MSSPAPQDPHDGGAINNNAERHDTPLLNGITEFLDGAVNADRETGVFNNVEADSSMTGNENNNNNNLLNDGNTQASRTDDHGSGTHPDSNDNQTSNDTNGEANGTHPTNNTAPTNNAATETEPPAAHAIQIRITSPDNETTFRIKTNTKMGRVMTAYAEKAGRSKTTMRFLYDGRRVNDSDTPETLELDDGDAIEVHQEQTGGGLGVQLSGGDSGALV